MGNDSEVAVPKKPDVLPDTRYIGVDLDEVLFPFADQLILYAREQLGIYIPEGFTHLHYYPRKILGLSRAWEIDLLCKFHLSDYYAYMPLFPGVRDDVDRLLNNHYRLNVFTACGHPNLDMKHVETVLKKRLHREFGKDAFGDINVIPATHPKKPYLQENIPTYYLDDGIRNVLDAIEAGYYAYLVKRPHNAAFAHTYGVPVLENGFREFVDRILNNDHPRIQTVSTQDCKAIMDRTWDGLNFLDVQNNTASIDLMRSVTSHDGDQYKDSHIPLFNERSQPDDKVIRLIQETGHRIRQTRQYNIAA